MRATRPGERESGDTADVSRGEGTASLEPWSKRFELWSKKFARLGIEIPPTAEPDRSGQHIAHFMLLSKLDEDAVGVVYHAQDLLLHRVVALKVLPRVLAPDAQQRQHFLRAARLAAAVRHPNLATVFEVGEHEDILYVAMERVEGVTLRELLVRRGGRLEHTEALRLARTIARCVSMVHDRGIAPLDLRPKTVMIAPDGAVRVLDFGLARALATLQPSADAQMGGSDASTERVTRMATLVGMRLDVFSIGMILYEMVSGRAALRGECGLPQSSEQDGWSPLGELAPGLSPSFVRLIERCLCQLPGDRFRNARAVLSQLDQVPDVLWRVVLKKTSPLLILIAGVFLAIPLGLAAAADSVVAVPLRNRNWRIGVGVVILLAFMIALALGSVVALPLFLLIIVLTGIAAIRAEVSIRAMTATPRRNDLGS